MSENNAPLKLRLKSTDTNHFKVANNDASQQAATAPAAPANAPTATQQIVDPISLRDTATGRLRKISENQDTQAAAPAMAMEAPNKTQTVRLKVVRQDNRSAGPQVPLQGAKPGLTLAKPPAGPSETQAVTPPKMEAERPALKLNLNKPEEKTAVEQATVATPPPAAPAAPQKTATVTLKKITPDGNGSTPAAPSLKLPGNAPKAPAGASPTATVKLAPPQMPPKTVVAPTPTLAKPAPAPAPTPTLAKKPEAPAAAPTPVVETAPVVNSLPPQEAPEGTPLLVSISTILAFVTGAAALVFDILTYLELLK